MASRKLANEAMLVREAANKEAAGAGCPIDSLTKIPVGRRHELRLVKDKLTCKQCKQWSNNHDRLMKHGCQGSIESGWATTAAVASSDDGGNGAEHETVRSGTITWCGKCGAYAESRARMILTVCAGRKHGPWQKAVDGLRAQLNKLMCRKHPGQHTYGIAGCPLGGGYMDFASILLRSAACRTDTSSSSHSLPPYNDWLRHHHRRRPLARPTASSNSSAYGTVTLT